MKFLCILLFVAIGFAAGGAQAQLALNEADESESKLPLSEQLKKRQERLTSVEQDLTNLLGNLLQNPQPHSSLSTLSQDLAKLAKFVPAASSCATLVSGVEDQRKNLAANKIIKGDSRAKVESLLGAQLTAAKSVEARAKVLSTHLGELEKECDSWIAGYNELNKIDHDTAISDLREHIREYLAARPALKHLMNDTPPEAVPAKPIRPVKRPG